MTDSNSNDQQPTIVTPAPQPEMVAQPTRLVEPIIRNPHAQLMTNAIEVGYLKKDS